MMCQLSWPWCNTSRDLLLNLLLLGNWQQCLQNFHAVGVKLHVQPQTPLLCISKLLHTFGLQVEVLPVAQHHQAQ